MKGLILSFVMVLTGLSLAEANQGNSQRDNGQTGYQESVRHDKYGSYRIVSDRGPRDDRWRDDRRRDDRRDHRSDREDFAEKYAELKVENEKLKNQLRYYQVCTTDLLARLTKYGSVYALTIVAAAKGDYVEYKLKHEESKRLYDEIKNACPYFEVPEAWPKVG